MFYFLRHIQRSAVRILNSHTVEPVKCLQQVKHVHTGQNCMKTWNLGKLNHVALVTPDLDKSAALYRDVLKGKVSSKQALPEHGVTVVFVQLGEAKIELLQPLGENSPVQSFLNKNKSGGMHHICIEVDDIQEAIKDFKKNKIRILSEEPKIGAHGKPVVFLHPKDCDGVLIEIEQA
ncbi:methylmalonyl-CoA epimerase mitochondrial [Biomphalaria glabrata]|uniref:Methylmalonyl-CoA epimerase, mitochondrial n=1 Tax=Biomphalaria glabrata TaxID=6526 RepID=A0A9W3AW88_BIOGL|nr:methylmalonyl-CoA epimerase, mitochondrial-like [Biomphalaria glabrata]XP_055891483.1 methylmalonyl-CoA epimerase, mitochondrial-like [Biomphalaria glabrata]XP_055891489.1 methylmalonyl-CoA epimerase, mitochondrial-like [Biomphalaria glabrata]KAI8770058.1 methylmalonyl-CoA epimerase; mitochondrial-like [Biomphalaria glabrata]KAI8774776.1 methylmalonyl-CoA epimerase, mitochondrial [Biomphalaria glabrata]